MAPTQIRRNPVEIRSAMDTQTFRREYMNRQPVVIKGGLEALPAVTRWTVPYLASKAPDLRVRLKTGRMSDGAMVSQTLGEYADLVADYTTGRVKVDGPPPYLHDLPLFTMIPELREDAAAFPAHLFPRFFRERWWTFPQFFVGPPGAMTPLHLDSRQTHNLFFQIHGTKRFIIVNPEDRRLCYTYNWRWSHVDAEKPDFEAHPLFRDARVFECEVDQGDILYMPPGALHHVRSLTASISFNIDWHDRRSAIRGLTAVRQGMPKQNLRYNALFALGVWAGVPLRALMPGLKSYFYYVS